MNDLTVIYLTVNQLPQRWERFHLDHLLRAVEDRPMVVVSRKPMVLDDSDGKVRSDTHYLIQERPPEGWCGWNVYKQLLRGAKLATTDYVAMAEADTLYPARHFSDFRPPMDTIAYDMTRWSVFSWAEFPRYSAIRKHGNFTMIGPRKLVIEAIEERLARHPGGHKVAGEIGRPDIERKLKVTPRKLVEWYCIESTVNLCHPGGLSPTYIGVKGHGRKPGELKAWDIPIWGKAEDIVAVYNQGIEEEGGIHGGIS